MKPEYKLIYLILDQEDRIPILTADTLEKAKELLDEYMGLGLDEDVKYLGYTRFDTEYADIFEGTFKYLTKYIFDKEPKEEKFLLYCMGLNDV